jgi:type IV pilus assembly protein PilQ
MQIGDRTRVVLDLARPARYKVEQKDRQYVVTIDPPATAATVASPTFTSPVDAVATTRPLASRPALRNIDFRKGAEGAGRVVVDLTSRESAINIAQSGKNIVVDFLDTGLPGSLRRRYDVTDFGTPVQGMVATDQGAGTRLTIEPRGNWEYSSYQTDTQFVVEVRPVKDDPNKLVAGPGYRGERLSLNFQSIDIRALLQVFADFTNLNVVTSDSVQGNLTLRLKDVPWDQALEIVLESKGLAELATKEKLDLESQAQIADLEPLRSQVFQLNYQRSEDVRKMLVGDGAGGTRVLSKRGSLTADARTNQLFVSDIGSKLEEIQNLLRKIDISVRQVIIEARIVEADDKFSRNLGAKLGFADLRGVRGGDAGFGGNTRAAIGNNYLGVGQATGQSADTGAYNSPFVSLPAAAIGSAQPASLAISLFSQAAIAS